MIKRNFHVLKLFSVRAIIVLFIDLLLYRLRNNYTSEYLKLKYQYELAYKKGYRFSRNKESMIVSYKDEVFRLRSFSSDWEVFCQIILDEEYKYFIDIDKVNIIVDLGSNIGLTVLYFNRYFKNAKFYCVEPFYNSWLQLKKNCEFVINSDSIFYNRAAWNDNSDLYINRNFRDGKEWSINVSNNSQNSIAKIGGISVMQIIEENKIDQIDILKIDIEGAEKELLLAPEFLLKTRNIAIEVHEEFIRKEEVKQLLVRYGFKLYDNGETIFGRKK